MTDHNILNRASFDDMQKTFQVSVQPFIREGTATMELGGPNNVFWIKRISWEYKYIDVGVPGARQTPIEPIQVSVENILQDVKRALPPFTEPRPIVGKIPFKVINTNLNNNHKLEVNFYLDGVLVTPKPNNNPLSLKQMRAYIMMDSTARGELALEEAAADELEETLVQLGMGSLREMLPGGIAGLKALPPPLQGVILQGLAAKGSLPAFMIPSLPGGPVNQPLALPNIDAPKEQSAFVGDIISSWPDDIKETLNKEQLQKLANTMIEKGWRRV
jgi:hypothetical protein